MFGVRTMPKRLLICMLLLQPLCGLVCVAGTVKSNRSSAFTAASQFWPNSQRYSGHEPDDSRTVDRLAIAPAGDDTRR